MSQGRMVYGLHAVQALLERDAGNIEKLLIAEQRKDKRLQSLLDKAARKNIHINFHPRAALDDIAAGGKHQGVIAYYRGHDRQALDLAGILAEVEGDAFILVLDGVQDPHNLGACLRSADAAGVHAVLVPKDNSVGLTPVVHKVACGAAESVPLIEVTNLARSLDWLKQQGIWLVGADGEADTSIHDAKLNGPLALVMGGEGKGLRRLTREACDVLVKIPMQGSVASLNVSVAAGICLFEALRQRRAS